MTTRGEHDRSAEKTPVTRLPRQPAAAELDQMFGYYDQRGSGKAVDLSYDDAAV